MKHFIVHSHWEKDWIPNHVQARVDRMPWAAYTSKSNIKQQAKSGDVVWMVTEDPDKHGMPCICARLVLSKVLQHNRETDTYDRRYEQYTVQLLADRAYSDYCDPSLECPLVTVLGFWRQSPKQMCMISSVQSTGVDVVKELEGLWKKYRRPLQHHDVTQIGTSVSRPGIVEKATRESGMSLTLIEKIATRYAVGLEAGRVIRSGDFVTIRPKHVMTHDNTGAVMPKFRSIVGEGGRIADPHQPVFAIDHDIQNKTPENLAKYARIEAFAREQGVDFYPAGTGISHQIMIEQGYVVPGAMVVGSDSHSNMYGAMSALGTPVVRTDAAAIWARGKTWWQVPPIARVVLTGKLQPGVTGKDAIIALCGLFNNDEVLNHAVEFVGPGVAELSMSHRMSMANMTTEWGALAGVFPFDEVLRGFLIERAEYFVRGDRPGVRHPGSLGSFARKDVERWWDERLEADEGATYAVEIELDLSTVVPHVSGPNHVKTMTSLPEIEARRVSIQKAYLVSCTNARLEDFAEAAAAARGKTVAEGVEFYIAAASANIQSDAERLGYWKDLVDAGARPLPPGCGPCIGLGTGLVEAGEVAISATNRNFKGRMGSKDAEVYLGSPAVVAASAVAGYICSPMRFEPMRVKISIRSEPAADVQPGGMEIIPGFPDKVVGRALLLDADNLNTDGIYAGKWTYKDDMTPGQMAEVTFENYDPRFNGLYHGGDVIVSGRNFGTGSSREQAATALKHKGVPCVIAVSFSQTYKRNAFNNGFPVFECPALVAWLRQRFGGGDDPTIIGPEIEIDFASSQIRVPGEGESFPFAPLSTVAQELVVKGGVV